MVCSAPLNGPNYMVDRSKLYHDIKKLTLESPAYSYILYFDTAQDRGADAVNIHHHYKDPCETLNIYPIPGIS